MREWYIDGEWTAYEPGTDNVDEKNCIHVVEFKEYEKMNKLFSYAEQSIDKLTQKIEELELTRKLQSDTIRDFAKTLMQLQSTILKMKQDDEKDS